MNNIPEPDPHAIVELSADPRCWIFYKNMDAIKASQRIEFILKQPALSQSDLAEIYFWQTKFPTLEKVLSADLIVR
jgi:hypothetical protein